MVSSESIPKWLERMRVEYHRVPGLHLTKPQVQRLWGLDAAISDALLDRSIAEHFLRKTPTGAYVRAEVDR